MEVIKGFDDYIVEVTLEYCCGHRETYGKRGPTPEAAINAALEALAHPLSLCLRCSMAEIKAAMAKELPAPPPRSSFFPWNSVVDGEWRSPHNE